MVPRNVGDVNCDGKADAVGFLHTGVFVPLSNGFSFQDVIPWSKAFGTNTGWRSQNIHPCSVGDVNGDGCFDIVGFRSEGVYVCFKNPSLDSI